MVPQDDKRGKTHKAPSTPPALNRTTWLPMANSVTKQSEPVENVMHGAKGRCTRTPATNVVLETLAKRSQ